MPDRASNEDIKSIAARQLADYDAGDPGTVFGEGLSLSEADAYRVQAAVASLREGRGELVIGYKVGCTSRTIQEQIGIDHPIYARLFDRECHPSGIQLRRSQFANLAVEGELAVRLGNDFQHPPDNPAALSHCIDAIFPTIELHHNLFRLPKPSAPELIANNGIHAGFVAPDQYQDLEAIDDLNLVFSVAGETIAVVETDELLANTVRSLAWLKVRLLEAGISLKPGDLVLTGSIPPLVPIGASSKIEVRTTEHGRVEATVCD